VGPLHSWANDFFMVEVNLKAIGYFLYKNISITARNTHQKPKYA